MAKKQTPSFEENLEQLETIVQQMEGGELSLAELMDSYAAGVKLSQKCMKDLERAEKAMDVMVRDEGEVVQELELKIEGE